jgi:hypothetical protein
MENDGRISPAENSASDCMNVGFKLPVIFGSPKSICDEGDWAQGMIGHSHSRSDEKVVRNGNHSMN